MYVVNNNYGIYTIQIIFKLQESVLVQKAFSLLR